MRDVVREYTNGEITVIWKSALCVHSGKCFGGLPEVFHPWEIPWISVGQSDSERIITQVKRCPSGALTIKDITLTSDEVKKV
ncbi:MAG: (4Fe-4S)-binding protein [bacterium]